MNVRIAVREDFPAMMEIYRGAQERMIFSANPSQWGRRYPTGALILADIDHAVCRVVEESGAICGVFSVFTGREPTYTNIRGAWRNDEPYLTIHRIASNGTVHGVFRCAADYCKTLCDNIRADTHKDNSAMRHLLKSNGFVSCGIIRVADGSERIAYHWVK